MRITERSFLFGGLLRVGVYLLGSRHEFSPFMNQPGKMAYTLTLYIDQSIYESTSLYVNTGL